MPILVRRRRIHRWSIAFVALMALAATTATFCLAAWRYGWLTRDQLPGVGGLLAFATLFAYVYVVMNWIESGGWSWKLVADNRCVDVSREFLMRLCNGDSDGAFDLTDSATFGDSEKGFARLAATWIARRTPVTIREQPLTTGPGSVPPHYRAFEGIPFSLVQAEFAESEDGATYVPTLRLVLRDDRYVVQAIETVVMGCRCEDGIVWRSCSPPQESSPRARVHEKS